MCCYLLFLVNVFICRAVCFIGSIRMTSFCWLSLGHAIAFAIKFRKIKKTLLLLLFSANGGFFYSSSYTSLLFKVLLLPFVNLNVAHFLIILDVDECVQNVHNCGFNAVCNNNPGSYNCTCSPGYHGDGRNCRRNYFLTHFRQCCVFILKLANLCKR